MVGLTPQERIAELYVALVAMTKDPTYATTAWQLYRLQCTTLSPDPV